ncbi:AAA family ATPase [Celeribacter neptunius]|uniref:AAA domain-containing protein, putative AbiEii toxin, Type IV TA system n=1 Tax=Celeribacter neptunius TaxID=588602 RepID=A0A1I3SAK1_9RHOB|nr:AAA family ATPase [Celeribacter neptunius]SFJ55758.1 AAA domain-containing protein, putative AbiEii toxin, Type IV TA system [Celeribacter neptunius]
MTFNLSFPTQSANFANMQLHAGELIFVLGANGTGKSSLMHLFASRNQNNVRKISAHRQTWMNSNALDMTPANKLQTEAHLKTDDRRQESRYKDPYGAQRASMTVYELINAENVRARSIAAAVDANDSEAVNEAKKVEAPITVINELLRESNIPIKITVRADERVMASKDGGPEYSVAELSDGERNALLIAGNVLTAPKGTLLIIDEPERHLHRSIIAPLLSLLFEQRSDCGFAVSTHDHDLPLEVPGARTLLIRACSFNGQHAQIWEADELPAEAPIDDVLKRDLLGSRRRMLFVEGTESSLDKPLYSLIFPMVSVIPKGNCREVENAVSGSRSGESFHWLRAFGIADGDGYNEEQIESKRQRGVYALPFYSVEAIYFHPEIINRIAARKAEVDGSDAVKVAEQAILGGVISVSDHTDRLSKNAAKKAVRKLIMDQLPNDDDLLNGQEITFTNCGPQIHATRKAELDAAVEDNDWITILNRCSIRECGARNSIIEALGFRTIADYEKAVRHLLVVDDDALTFVRGLFGQLPADLEI